LRLSRFSPAPVEATPVQRKNFLNVQIDAIGIGMANAAAQFLPVFLTRMGASSVEVGLLTSMPAMTGLILAIPLGRFLQTRRQVVPWFSAARLMVVSCYALTGLVTLLIPEPVQVRTVLLIWAAATIPQTVVAVCFSVVMNAVAGPKLRYELMSRRWSILGITSALTVAAAGQLLDQVIFPTNYLITFMGLSLGGLISYYFSSHIILPDADILPEKQGKTILERLKDQVKLVVTEKAFVHFSLKRLVFLFGTSLSLPLFPLYYVREVDASDAWIGIINTAQSAILLVGYFLWTRESRLRGSRFVLLWATFGMTVYPALVAFTHEVELIALYAGIAGIFQAGLDLVFFDELMKTVPPEYSATFVSIAQSLTYLASILAPLLGTLIADQFGLSAGLVASGVIRLTGFLLFSKRAE
jgi:Na+/melibiose symporter-like transporter